MSTKRAGEMVTITARDGHTLAAYRVASPARPRGAIVVIQEVFGVTDYIKNLCDSFAGDGYTAIAPALYDRQQRDAVFDRSSIEQGRQLRLGLVWDNVVADCGGAYDAVASCGKVGIVGYCVGGSVAWRAACGLPFAAASGYYGKDIADWVDKPPPGCPTQLHFGAQDKSIPLSDVEKIRAAFPELPVYVYPTGHGFDCPDRPGYHADSARLARARTDSLFHQHVG